MNFSGFILIGLFLSLSMLMLFEYRLTLRFLISFKLNTNPSLIFNLIKKTINSFLFFSTN